MINATSNWQSILTSLQAGDTAYFAPGTYSTTSRLGLSLDGTWENPITIGTQPGSSTRAIIYRPNENQNIMDIDGYNFVLSDLEFTGGSKGLRLGYGNSLRGITNVTLHNLLVHDTAETAVSCNDGGTVCSNVIVEYCEIYNTGDGTGECFYFGCVGGGCTTHHTIFRYNYCHDTTLATSGSLGSGFQIKTGSYSNYVVNNVCDRTRGPCILLYDDWNRGTNYILGNLAMNSQDCAIQAAAGAVIANNIVLDCAAHGIMINNHDMQSGQQPRNITIVHNTIRRSTQTSSCCLYGSSWSYNIDTFSVANNAFLCPSSTAICMSDDQTGASWFYNAYLGGSVPSSITSSGAFLVPSIEETIGDDTQSVYPVTGSDLIDAGQGGWSDQDFNCLDRSASTPTVGAYEFVADENPGWELQDAIKECVGGDSSGASTINPVYFGLVVVVVLLALC
ncbi:chondroitinase B [Pelomyxa schiedti]|nr:chondroitinase B [Pelomyxa schiedti]